MDRYEGDAAMCMPAEADKYVQETICHILEPCSCRDHWEVKFAEVVDSQRQLQEQIYVLLRRLEEADLRCSKSREEAALNAQALKRQVAETQRLAVECKSLTLDCEALTQKCTRLEKECNLYHNDREVFMEVADDAEERAAQAEDRADEANRRLEELLQELENVRGCTSVVHPLPEENLGTTKENVKDEMSVSNMVSSAILAGVVSAVEQERDEALSSLNLQFKAILKRMEGEFRSSRERLLKKWTESERGRERMKVAEKGMKSLLVEAHALRQEVAFCKNNLDKAQEQITLLAEKNKDLRLLLKIKCNSCLGYTRPPFVSRGVRFITTLHAWHKCPEPLE